MSETPTYRDGTAPIAERVEDLLGRMTLPEKVGQMLQLNGQIEPVKTVREMQPGSLLHILNDELAQAMDAAAETRLGIPLLVGEDGIHGHSFHPGATIFPTQLAMACSWSEQLLEAAARVTAREMATTGAHWTFSPVLCLSRDLRWGRTGETFGEDPFLIAEFGAAMIRGYQGAGLDDPDGVLACAKHYAGYSETQGGRDASEADISRRKLRSFFLPPFERAARLGCMTFMTGYQSMDGLPSTANRWLLTEVLKEEWGFTGILVTDWDNVGRLHWEQRVVPSPKEAAVVAVRCGNDLIMATPSFFQAAQAAVREGLLSEAEIDAVVRRILTLKFRMGLFENPRRPDRAKQALVIACPEHRALNLELARQSLVLLQNDGCLPLAADKLRKIAVIGPNADDALAQLGDWSLGSSQHPPSAGQQPRACTVTLLDGIVARVPATVSVVYARGCSLDSTDASELAAALSACSNADVIVLAVGDALPFIGETLSTATLELPGGQAALLNAIIDLGKPVVLALVSSKPLVLPAASERAAAIVCCFNPGMQGGTAFAELLFGDLNPSGKLTISFPKHVGQQPCFYSQIRGQHGNSYADLDQTPRFPFGFGLSYTEFEYSDLRLARTRLSSGEALELSFELYNRGARAGTEIVQVYGSDLVTSVTWVNKALLAFARVTLAAGERRCLTLTIPQERLSLVDAFERRVVEPGEFEVSVAPSSREASALRARFVVEGEPFSFSRIPGVAAAAQQPLPSA
ncbi:MAG TPA: glycoside hydrolase family 3 N-terminal domain-containing protein [Polyangiaceae bacterium]|nr:glycoside hydrolase family 3 N-terminal domain-containing protein [Polyangiaceae bacterium]